MSRKSAEVVITKTAAASRHLDAAIRLTLSGEDELAVHTLAAAAYQVLRDLKKNRGQNELHDLYGRGIYRLAYGIVSGKLDGLPPEILSDKIITEWVYQACDYIRDGTVKNETEFSRRVLISGERDYWKQQNQPANFLKHADSDSGAILPLGRLNNQDILLKAIACYVDLLKRPTLEMFIYGLYVFGHEPSFRSPLWKDSHAETYRKLSPAKRRQFCRSYLFGLKKIWKRKQRDLIRSDRRSN